MLPSWLLTPLSVRHYAATQYRINLCAGRLIENTNKDYRSLWLCTTQSDGWSPVKVYMLQKVMKNRLFPLQNVSSLSHLALWLSFPLVLTFLCQIQARHSSECFKLKVHLCVIPQHHTVPQRLQTMSSSIFVCTGITLWWSGQVAQNKLHIKSSSSNITSTEQSVLTQTSAFEKLIETVWISQISHKYKAWKLIANYIKS